MTDQGDSTSVITHSVWQANDGAEINAIATDRFEQWVRRWVEEYELRLLVRDG